MTSPTARAMPTVSPNGRDPESRVSLPLPTANRPKGYVALAVMLIVGLGALGYWFYAQAGAKTAVLSAARDIPAGHVITASDLTSVQVAGAVTAVGADHVSEVVGHTAAVEILLRTPVQLAMLAAGSPLNGSQALVGVAEAPGQIPSSGLAPGDRVAVLQLPQKTAAVSSVGTPVIATATVYDVRANLAAEGGTLLTLLAPKAQAYPITAASDAGLVALVKIGGTP